MNTLLHKRVTITLFLISIITLVVSGFIGYAQYQGALSLNRTMIESYETIRATNQAMFTLNEASLELNTYLVTNDKDAIKNLPELMISVDLNLNTLNNLIQDNAEEIALFKQIAPLVAAKNERMKQIAATYTGNTPTALQLILDPNRTHLRSQINQLLMSIKHVEVGQLEEAIELAQAHTGQANRFFILAGALDVLLFLISFSFMRRYVI